MKPAILIKRLMMSYLISDFRRNLSHWRGRRPHTGVVHYFHQVDDPYSHLAVQKLDALRQRYQIPFQVHLVSAPPAVFQGDSDRFSDWAVRDARSIADFYGTFLPREMSAIDPDQVLAAEQYLHPLLSSPDFASEAMLTGNRLWRGESLPAGSGQGLAAEGDSLRADLGHYLSATFYYEGEWYWGLDRLHHLERRLCGNGLSSDPRSIVVPQPSPEVADNLEASHVTLEYFPSLRSPYSAISVNRTLDLAKRTGVTLQLKPVMPMMMRGVPAPRAKQFYIMTDCKREADYYGEAFGPIVDPFGEPVREAFALLPFMMHEGKAEAFCAEYLHAAWTEDLDITTEKGLRQVVESVGVDWPSAKANSDKVASQRILDSNVSEMLDAGLWGVPSYRVSGGSMSEPFCCWGQDRLWRVETEIAWRAQR